MFCAAYQILPLSLGESFLAALKARVECRLSDLGLPVNSIKFIDETEWDHRFPLIAFFMGSPHAATASYPILDALLDESITIVPIVSSLAQASSELPEKIRHINAIETPDFYANLDHLINLAFELFHLARCERKLFISYRRVDSQPFAEKLYDKLDAKGYDVFIDLRSIPPAVDFQEELWHRMADVDIVILIDTPGFRKSRWTTEELARANATNIQILHLLWPGQQEDSESAFSHFMKLSRKDFTCLLPGCGKLVKHATLDRICNEVERLRSRAISSRYRYLVDSFCDLARDRGFVANVHPQRWISIHHPSISSKILTVIPTIGVPNAKRIHDIFKDIKQHGDDVKDVCIIYDNRGVLNSWLAHLDWLKMHLPIKTVKMGNSEDLLREFVS